MFGGVSYVEHRDRDEGQPTTMHTSFSRAQSVFSTFTTVVMVVSVLISLTAYIQLYTSGAHSLPARVGKFTP